MGNDGPPIVGVKLKSQGLEFIFILIFVFLQLFVFLRTNEFLVIRIGM